MEEKELFEPSKMFAEAEAPVSATIKVTWNGFDVMFTIRGGAPDALIEAMPGLLALMAESGAAPVTYRKGNGGGSGTTQDKPVGKIEIGEDGVPICPYHKAPMRDSKYGGFYCTKKVDGEYCKYKYKEG